MLALTACQRPQPALTVTPTTRTVALVGDRTTSFVVANTGMTGSKLTWTFVSDVLVATPDRGTLAAGDQRTVSVSVPDDAPGTPFTGTFASATETANVTVHLVDALVCDPETAYATPSRTANQILVAFEAAVGRAAIARAAAAASSLAIAEAAGGRLVRRGLGPEHDLLEVPVARVQEVLEALHSRPEVAYAVPNVPVFRASEPDDPLYERQWNLSLFGSEAAWVAAAGVGARPPVVIAIVDDGVAVDHPDLADVVLPGWDVANNDADVRNCTDHGTHVAGIAAAVRGNGIGVAGVASVPWARLLPVKAWPDTVDDRTSTSIDAILRGMRWAAGLLVAGTPANPHPAQVVNLSLGTPDASTAAAFTTVIAELEAAGVVVVSAAGNSGAGTGVDFPARAGGVAVGSVDGDFVRSHFSTYGTGLTLMAPGGVGPAVGCTSITSTGVMFAAGIATHDWTCKAGTSMATPYVAGAVALLIGLDASLERQPALVKARLTDAAALLRPDDYSSSTYGAGVLCLDALTTTTSVCGLPAP